ncbi:MAG TPA: hypothetical protein VK492_11140 [Chitinophagaceae bacterium]|nr:hypothetical protein [Chitinophagaceae bacterium]
MKQIFLLLAITTAIGCFHQADKKNVSKSTISPSGSTSKNYVDTISLLENQSTILNYDSLGQLISKIRFDVKTNNLEDYENGKIPWIRIDSPQIDIKNLIGKDELVISETKLTIIIDYPLISNYKFEIFSKDGFTRAHLINEISKRYYQLYDEEEKTATIKTVPLKERKIYNRNQTNGKYGIWGHDIGDLVLDEIHVYKNTTGEVFLILQLES